MVDLALANKVFFRLFYPRMRHASQADLELDLKKNSLEWSRIVTHDRYVGDMFSYQFSAATPRLPTSFGSIVLWLTENPYLPRKHRFY